MPEYTFKCPDGHLSTVVISFKDSVVTRVACAECRQMARRVYQPLRTTYHGTGFYTTDKRLDYDDGGPPSGFNDPI